MVSELATNCIRHVKTGFQLTIRRTRREIRVEVTDHGGGTPAMRSPGPDDPTGRGLRIVDMLSERWGVDHERRGGKTVWFTLGPSTTQEATGGQTHSLGQEAEGPGIDRATRMHAKSTHRWAPGWITIPGLAD
jgi:hypothetical protein